MLQHATSSIIESLSITSSVVYWSTVVVVEVENFLFFIKEYVIHCTLTVHPNTVLNTTSKLFIHVFHE